MNWQRKSASAVVALALVIWLSAGCRHTAATHSVSQNMQVDVEPTPGQVDQVNTEGWNQAWTNLVNDVEQSFTPSLPRLTAVEVELVLANPGAQKDQLTLAVLDASGQTLAAVARNVSTENLGPVVFEFTKGGVEVSPGQTYRLRLSGGLTFGWKYIVGGYETGEATFNGKPLLRQARSTFLFRTFGTE
jgi:hypothetical protein